MLLTEKHRSTRRNPFRIATLSATNPMCVDLGSNPYLTLQRGVTGTARMLHALTHSSISRQVREQM